MPCSAFLCKQLAVTESRLAASAAATTALLGKDGGCLALCGVIDVCMLC
jgi:hypothetical protein